MSDEKIPPIVSPATPAPHVRPDRVGRASDADERDRRSREAPPRYLKDNDTPFALAWRVLTSRYRSMRDKAGRDFMRRTLRIGISAVIAAVLPTSFSPKRQRDLHMRLIPTCF